jgi:hypothetical protein
MALSLETTEFYIKVRSFARLFQVKKEGKRITLFIVACNVSRVV